MTASGRQIGLPLDLRGGREREFLVGEANRLAVRHLEHWGAWPVRTSILVGPRWSGRSTLARQFAHDTGGAVIDDARLKGEEELFHAWNHAQEHAAPLLLVADAAPAEWNVRLPDLASRLSAAPIARIAEPDDALARALIDYDLAQAGTAFSSDLPAYLHQRIERSYAAIHAVTDLLNQASLSSGRKISVPFAKETLNAAGMLLP